MYTNCNVCKQDKMGKMVDSCTDSWIHWENKEVAVTLNICYHKTLLL